MKDNLETAHERAFSSQIAAQLKQDREHEISLQNDKTEKLIVAISFGSVGVVALVIGLVEILSP